MPGPGTGLAEAKSFYDDYVEEHVPYHRSPQGLKRAILQRLPYWSYCEWRFWEKWVPRCDALLDLGCARGREVFREKANCAIGVDLAHRALADCVAHYDGAALASMTDLPFPDESFDCVVTSHVLGHVPPAAKPAVFAEVARVLKPGGRSVHVIETDSARSLIQTAKQHPNLYQRRILDPDGHVGLEPASQALERFKQNELHPVAVEKMEVRNLHPRLWVKWFDNEYSHLDREIGEAVDRAKRTLGTPIWLACEEIALGRQRYTSEQDAPLDEAMFIAAALEKRG